MKTVFVLALGISTLAALPLEAGTVNKGDSSLLLQVDGPSANRMLAAGGDDVNRPPAPTVGDFFVTTHPNGKAFVLDNGGEMLGDSPQFIPTQSLTGPVLTNGPGTLPSVAVPEPASSVLFLVLGALGMIALRRRLHTS